MLRQLEHLSLRIWDDGNHMAAERLQQVQQLLDLLNTAGAAPRVRDARWLIQTAQSPLTRHLKPYFMIADRVAGSFMDRDRREIHKAGAALAGGHLRSQLRHRSWQTGWAFDDPQVIALTHLSNSMDMALLVGDLDSLVGGVRRRMRSRTETSGWHWRMRSFRVCPPIPSCFSPAWISSLRRP